MGCGAAPPPYPPPQKVWTLTFYAKWRGASNFECVKLAQLRRCLRYIPHRTQPESIPDGRKPTLEYTRTG